MVCCCPHSGCTYFVVPTLRYPCGSQLFLCGTLLHSACVLVANADLSHVSEVRGRGGYRVEAITLILREVRQNATGATGIGKRYTYIHKCACGQVVHASSEVGLVAPSTPVGGDSLLLTRFTSSPLPGQPSRPASTHVNLGVNIHPLSPALSHFGVSTMPSYSLLRMISSVCKKCFRLASTEAESCWLPARLEWMSSMRPLRYLVVTWKSS